MIGHTNFAYQAAVSSKFLTCYVKIAQTIIQNFIAYHNFFLILNLLTTGNFELCNNFQIKKQKLESLWYVPYTPQFILSSMFVNISELDKLVDHVDVRTVGYILAPTVRTCTHHMTVQAAGRESVYEPLTQLYLKLLMPYHNTWITI